MIDIEGWFHWLGYQFFEGIFGGIEVLADGLYVVATADFINYDIIQPIINNFQTIMGTVLVFGITTFTVLNMFSPQKMLSQIVKLFKIVIYTEIIYYLFSMWNSLITAIIGFLETSFGLRLDGGFGNSMMSKIIIDRSTNQAVETNDFFPITRKAYNEKIIVNGEQVYRFELEATLGFIVAGVILILVIYLAYKVSKANIGAMARVLIIPVAMWFSLLSSSKNADSYMSDFLDTLKQVGFAIFSLFFALLLITELTNNVELVPQIFLYLGMLGYLVDGDDFGKKETGMDSGLSTHDTVAGYAGARVARSTGKAVSGSLTAIGSGGYAIGNAIGAELSTRNQELDEIMRVPPVNADSNSEEEGKTVKNKEPIVRNNENSELIKRNKPTHPSEPLDESILTDNCTSELNEEIKTKNANNTGELELKDKLVDNNNALKNESETSIKDNVKKNGYKTKSKEIKNKEPKQKANQVHKLERKIPDLKTDNYHKLKIEKPTNKQLQSLKNMGYSENEIGKLDRGAASKKIRETLGAKNLNSQFVEPIYEQPPTEQSETQKQEVEHLNDLLNNKKQ